MTALRRSSAWHVRWPLFALGLVLTLVGVAMLGGLALVLYSNLAPFRAWEVKLGLALAALISGVGHSALLVGLWTLRQSFRRAERGMASRRPTSLI